MQFVSKFRYLGHILSDDDDIRREIKNLFVRTNMLISSGWWWWILLMLTSSRAIQAALLQHCSPTHCPPSPAGCLYTHPTTWDSLTLQQLKKKLKTDICIAPHSKKLTAEALRCGSHSFHTANIPVAFHQRAPLLCVVIATIWLQLTTHLISN